MGQQAGQGADPAFLIAQIGDADGAAADLVLIGGADAAPGRADFRRPGRLFAQPVQVLMQRQNQRVFSAIIRFSGLMATPCAASLSISANSAQGPARRHCR